MRWRRICRVKSYLTVICLAGFCGGAARAATLDTIGVTLLRAVTTNLNGSGINVGQVEAYSDTNTFDFQVNPGAVGQPTNLFTYIIGASPYASVSMANTFTNSLGAESFHADSVAYGFYGITNGVATNTAAVRNYEANTFINYYINANRPINDRVVNQSYTYGSYNMAVDQIFDNYAAQRNVLFVNGAGQIANPVWSPATCYNGIGVGVANNGGSPYGPTSDGRSKPDICAPGDPDLVTSYATSWVSGGATILLQAALRGDGGSTNAAANIRTLKALLLNGAIKPADWTNSPANPLHSRYGAGAMNVFNSYKQLTGGWQGYTGSNSVSGGGAHPPLAGTGTISVLSGWSYTNIISGNSSDAVHHFVFNVTNATSDATFTATATLVWNRQQNQTSINNLDLFLYDCASSNLVLCSTSLVDNVEHLYIPRLPAGRYDLQVVKVGTNAVSSAETYALAWEFFAQPLSIARSAVNTTLTWPVYPAGFVVETTTNLTLANWSTNLPAVSVSNGLNRVSISNTDTNRFFRLRRP